MDPLGGAFTLVVVLALMAALKGPTAGRARIGVPRPLPEDPRKRARKALARYLEARRLGLGGVVEAEADADEPAMEDVPRPETLDRDGLRIRTMGRWCPLGIWLFQRMAEIYATWEGDVLDAEPGHLPRGLSLVARRGAAMFREFGPDLSGEFDALRRRFDAHARNAPPMTDAEFQEAFERIEALQDSAMRRTGELIEIFDLAWQRRMAPARRG